LRLVLCTYTTHDSRLTTYDSDSDSERTGKEKRKRYK